MKRIITFLVGILFFSTTSFAQEAKETIKVSPVPVQKYGAITVVHTTTPILNVILYTTAGRRLGEWQKLSQSTVRLQLPDDVAEGSYFIKISCTDEVVAKQIIITR